MKVGDQVICEGKKGKIIRFQPKTCDLIVKSESGEIFTFSPFRAQVISHSHSIEEESYYD